MGIEKKVKQRIIEDWQNAFPQLTSFAENKLYKIVGPSIVGLELIKSNRTESYSPYFVIYSLWGSRIGNDIKACLAGPILLKDFKNKRGFQYDIPYEKHNLFFDELLYGIKEQIPLPFDGDISLKIFLEVLEEYSRTPPLSAAPNSYLQAGVQEAKLKIALFIGLAEALEVFEEIKKRKWDINHFKACGVDLDEWLQRLQALITNRDEFLNLIELNKLNKKISKLKTSDLIL